MSNSEDLEILKEALEFYANKDNWRFADNGSWQLRGDECYQKAQKALTEVYSMTFEDKIDG